VKRANRRRKRAAKGPGGEVVILALPKGQKPYYEISLGYIRAIAEWRNGNDSIHGLR
jgi:hypothetical protein